MNLKKILLPIDFSPGSVTAAKQAGVLARHFHSEVTMLHVNDMIMQTRRPELGGGLSGWEVPFAEYEAACRERLDGFGLSELEGVPVRRLLCIGDPARVIVARAEADDVNLILMPTRGHGTFRRLLLGSVTAKVLHDANCPVWTGAHFEDTPASEWNKSGHVLCAVDFSPQSAKVVRYAADFAAEFGSKLTVAHAVTKTPPELAERYTMSWHDEARWGTDERLHCLIRELCVPADVLVVNGDAPMALAEAVRINGASLLVIGRCGARGAFGRLSSRAYGIICHAPCPVVSI